MGSRIAGEVMGHVGCYFALACAGIALAACSDHRDGDGRGGASGVAGSGGALGAAAGASPGAGTGGLSGAPGGGTMNNAGGAPAGAAGVAGDAGGGFAGAASAGQTGDGCLEATAALRSEGTLVEVQTELMLAGKAVEYAEPNAIEGGTLMPLELRFYVSEVELIRSDTSTVAVDIVTNTGTPVPYGVHLVNAEDPASLRFSLLAPPGSYSGVSFTFGLKESCNTGLMDRKAPLSAASQMTWPHTFGYLFLRYAGQFQPAGDAAPNPAGGGAARPPGVIHMGGVPG
ncbi:MAG TPA: MbnP family protein, partial [Polyangiaceae bacterium]